MISIRDEFFKIATLTNARLMEQNLSVYPKCAGIIEICQLLTGQDESVRQREMKYPGIFLLKDYAEEYMSDYMDRVQVNVHILIVADSRSDYTTDEREEKVFRPVLYPICEEFIRSADVYAQVDLTHGFQKIDRGFISNALSEAVSQSKQKNLFNDALDGIELRNLKLVFEKQC